MTKKDFDKGRIDASKAKESDQGPIDMVVFGPRHYHPERAEDSDDYNEGWKYESKKKK